ncbi:MAG TPA: hypothetical protein VGF95_08960 [Solirubrobacteraceae bacterium]|jgi:hypothetical protein
MPVSRRARIAACAAAAFAASICLALGAGIALAGQLHASDRAKLRYVAAVGEKVYETGQASGTLPGDMRVHMVFSSTFSGSFTIDTPVGEISGRGRARPHGEGVIESFKGTLVVTGGSGRYSHAHGSAGLYGTFNRNNYSLTIKTAGTLHY